MMNDHLLTELARRRQAELLMEAEDERLARTARASNSRHARTRRGGVTVEIRLSGNLRPEQIDQIFASLARHLG